MVLVFLLGMGIGLIVCLKIGNYANKKGWNHKPDKNENLRSDLMSLALYEYMQNRKK
jgi:hypothetical protein